MSNPAGPTREPPARRVPAAPGRPSSRRPRASSSSAAMPRRPSRRSATARIPRRRRSTGCSPRSSGSSRPCSTSRSEVTTRRLPWRTARRFVRSLSDEDPKNQLAGFAALLREVMARAGARSSHPRRRGQIRRGRGFAARRDRSATSRGPAAYRTLTRSFGRPAAWASRARRRRHHPRPRLSRGVRLACLRPRLERRAVREVVEVDPHRPASPIMP